MANTGGYEIIHIPMSDINVALKLADVMSSTFGGPHYDMQDTLGQLTVMMALSHFSEVYEKCHNPGRFHILGLGLYIQLHEFVSASFSGFFCLLAGNLHGIQIFMMHQLIGLW